MMRQLLTALLALALSAPCVGCTESILLATEGADGDADGDVDGDADGDGDGDVLPDGGEEMDERVVVVMDQSASLQCTDQEMIRQTLIHEEVEARSAEAGALMAYVGFHASVYVEGFTTPSELEAAAAEHIVQLGPATDYQGALATTRDLIELDMASSTAEERARTRYVVQFYSDGVPEPRCDHGCEDDDTTCSDGADNDGDGAVDGADADCADTFPDALYGVCNYLGALDGSYVDMLSPCAEYNTETRILGMVDEIVRLAARHGAGGVRLDTYFLFAPQEVVDARCGGSGASFAYVWDEAMPLLEAMAAAGGGSLTDVNTEDREPTDPVDPVGPYVAYECDDRYDDCGAGE